MYLEVLNQEERFGLCFCRLNDRDKGTTNAFSSHKLTTKLCLVYLEVKIEVRLLHLVMKMPENCRKIRHLEANKHQGRCDCCF